MVETSRQLSRRTVCYELVHSNAHLDSLGVHFVVFVGLCPIQTRVPFLANKQVREVDFLKLQFDGFLELCRHQFSCLGA